MRRLPLLAVIVLLALSAISAAAPIRHNYDLKDVLWRVSFSMENGTIAGDVTNTVTLNEATPTVQFHCAELAVQSTTVDGVAATFSNDGGLLTVTLPKEGTAGQTLKIRTVYTGAPVSGLYFVPASRAFPAHTGMIYTQGQGEDNHYWLPTYDYPDDKATFECFIDVPAGWTAISNGRLLGVAESKAGRQFHWKLDQPCSTYLISLVAGPYVEGKSKWRSVPVSYFVPPGLEAEGRASFAATPKMIECYSNLTGVPYPYAKFAQEVVADFMFGGMENVTCVTQTIRTLHRPDTEPVNDSTGLVAHELAHQWFGDLITCRTWEHSWLNEGFATTLPVFYDRQASGVETFDIERYGNIEGAIDSIGSRNRGDIQVDIGSSRTVTVGSVYNGGSARIMMLDRLLGEKLFWKGIRAFLTRYAFQPVTTQNFFDVMSEVSGRKLNSFMKQWYYTPATPSLTISTEGGDVVVRQLKPYYALDLPVWILNGNRWVANSIHLSGAEARLPMGDLAGHPFLVDPEVWTLAEMKIKAPFSQEDVLSLYHHAPNAAQRARIIDLLIDTIPVSARVALGREERSPLLLQRLCRHVDGRGEDFLLALTHNADKRVVSSAVLQLTALPRTDASSLRLTQMAFDEANETVRERSEQAVLNWSADASVAERAWGLHAFDDGFRKMALEWFGTHHPDLARSRALEVLAHPDSEPLRIAAIQVLGRVKESPGSSDVYTALIKVASETSYNARVAAINALGSLGNKNAVAVLRPFTEHAPNGVRGTAAGVIAKLSN